MYVCYNTTYTVGEPKNTYIYFEVIIAWKSFKLYRHNIFLKSYQNRLTSTVEDKISSKF